MFKEGDTETIDEIWFMMLIRFGCFLTFIRGWSLLASASLFSAGESSLISWLIILAFFLHSSFPICTFYWPDFYIYISISTFAGVVGCVASFSLGSPITAPFSWASWQRLWEEHLAVCGIWGESVYRAELAGYYLSGHHWAAGASVFSLCKSTGTSFYLWNLAQNPALNMKRRNCPCQGGSALCGMLINLTWKSCHFIM